MKLDETLQPKPEVKTEAAATNDGEISM
jgi:hypothetical protein